MDEISQDVKTLVSEAIKLEIDGQAFFNHAAAATANELGKTMFVRLAQEEVKHLEAFSRLFSAVMKSDDWKSRSGARSSRDLRASSAPWPTA